MRRIWFSIILVLLLPILAQATVSYVDTAKVPNDASDCRNLGSTRQDTYDDIELMGGRSGYIRILPPDLWWSSGGMIHDSTILWMYCSDAGADSIQIYALDTSDCPTFEANWNPYGHTITGFWKKWTPAGTGIKTIEIDTILQYWKNVKGNSQGDYLGLGLIGYGTNTYIFDDYQKAGSNEARLIFYFSGDSVKNCYWYADTILSYIPATVQFTDTTDGTPAGWLWDFGDGGTSNQQNPLHTYTKPGIYTVTLTTWDIWADTVSLEKERYIAISGGGTYFVPILCDSDDAYQYGGTEYTTGDLRWGYTTFGAGAGYQPYLRFWIDSLANGASVDSVTLWTYMADTTGADTAITNPYIASIDSANLKSQVEGSDFSAWAVKIDSIGASEYYKWKPWTALGWKRHPNIKSLFTTWNAMGDTSDRYWGLKISGDKKSVADVEAKITAFASIPPIRNAYLQFWFTDMWEDFHFSVTESLNSLIKFKTNYLSFLNGASIRYSSSGYPGKTGGTLGDSALSADDTILIVKGLTANTLYYFSLIAHTDNGSFLEDSLICHTLSLGNWDFSQNITLTYTGSDTLVNYVASTVLRPTGISDVMFIAGTPKACYFKNDTYERTYYLYITATESLKVGYYDHKTKKFSSPVSVTAALGQMHGMPGMTVDTLGYIHLWTGAHGEQIDYYRSYQPCNLDSFLHLWTDSSSTVHPCDWNPVLEESVCIIEGAYPTAFTDRNTNRVEVTLRRSSPAYWATFYSTNLGSTFHFDTLVTSTSLYYYVSPILWENDTTGLLIWDEHGIYAGGSPRPYTHGLVTYDSGAIWTNLIGEDTVAFPPADTNTISRIWQANPHQVWRDGRLFDSNLNPIVFVLQPKNYEDGVLDSCYSIRLWYNFSAATCDTDTVMVRASASYGLPQFLRIEAGSADSIWYCIMGDEDWPQSRKNWMTKQRSLDYGLRIQHFWIGKSLDSGNTWTQVQDLERAVGLSTPDPIGFAGIADVENAPIDGAIRYCLNRGWGKDAQAYFWPVNFTQSTEQIFPYNLCRPDGGDIRIKKGNDYLHYRFDEWQYQGASRLFWKVDTIIPNDTLIFTLEYGNPDAGDASWPESVFSWWGKFPEWNMRTAAKTENVEGGVHFVDGRLVDAFSQTQDTAKAWAYTPPGIVRGWVYDIPHTESDSCGHDFCVSVWRESTSTDTFSIRFWMKNESQPRFRIQDKSKVDTVKDAAGVAIYATEPFTIGWHNIEFRPDGKTTLDYYHTYQMDTDTFHRIAVGRWNPLTKNDAHETYYADFSVSPFYASDSLVSISLGDPPLSGYWIYNDASDWASGVAENVNVEASGDWLILISEADTGIFYTVIENAEWALDPGDTNSQGEPNKTADLWKVSWDDSIPTGTSVSYYVAASDSQEDLADPNSISWILVSASEDDPDLHGMYQRGKIILRPSGGNGPIVYEFRGDYTIINKSTYNWFKAMRHGQWYDAGLKKPARW